MEWFFSLFDKLAQLAIWKFLFGHFKWVDWISVLFVLVGMIYGAKKGLLRMVVEIFEMFLAAYIVFSFYKKLSKEIELYFGMLPDFLIPGLTYITIGLPVFIALAVIDGRLIKLFHTKLVGPVRVIGGMAAGAFLAFFLWSFLAQPLVLSGSHAVTHVFDKGNSFTGQYVKVFAPGIYSSVSSRN